VFHHDDIAGHQIGRGKTGELVVWKVPRLDAEEHAERTTFNHGLTRLGLELLRSQHLRMKGSFYLGVKALSQVEGIGRELNPDLNGFSVGTNATFIRSEVTLPAQEAEELAAIGFAEPTRDMTATPAYILNGNVMYEWEKTGTSVALFYIEQGDTLVAGAGTARENYIPSIYATPHGVLNFTLQQNLSEHWKFFFQAKNLLNPEIQTVYRSPYLPSDIVNTSYTAGVDFVVGLNCKWVF
jgi:hypothetical protein